MYHVIRRIHLFTGLGLLVFVVMYFVSGYVMIHARWFGQTGPATRTRTEALAVAGDTSDDALSQYLQDKYDLRGKRNPANHRKDGTRQFGFVRPGTTIEALVSKDGKQVTISERRFGFVGTANGFHRLRGYGGGWLYDLWSLLYDLASAALILFALTGVVLWYQSTRRHLAGFICLGLGFGFTASMILYLMFRR